MSTDSNFEKEQPKSQQIDDNSKEYSNEKIFEQAKTDNVKEPLKGNDDFDADNDCLSEGEFVEAQKPKQNKNSVFNRNAKSKKKIEDNFVERRKRSKWPLLVVVSFFVIIIFGAMFSAQKFFAERERNKEVLANELSNLEKSMTANFETQLSDIKTGSIKSLKKTLVSQGLNIELHQNQIDDITKAKKSVEFGGEKIYLELQDMKTEIESKTILLSKVANQLLHLQNRMKTVDFNKLSKIDLSKIEQVISAKPSLPTQPTQPTQPVKKIKPKTKAPLAKTLYSIDGFTLYSIDMFGDEKIAVFTKDLESKKVRVKELFKGYSINNILMKSGVVYFSKDSKRYSMRVGS